MIGNDIVDLQLAKTQSNWQRKGWLQKICTIQEQQYIFTSEKAEIQLWQFWSMKEAAYKAHQRRFNLSRRYNPLNFECTPKGEVYVGNYRYKIITETQNEYVYSIAMVSDEEYHSSVYGKKTNARSKLKEIISEKLNIDSSLIYFTKNSKGIPLVHIDQKAIQLPLSFTYHGKYSAFVVSI
ncbi:4'-phosphopantetheinyl transferase family protein [Aquimarina megaterium]|uniref:4'-phosphopantetheinyl transferase family protein n=1 Tax=Aquimarina megaterium TaxID=1443666 RepID=UPI00046E86FA|nr:4'-phosphopantetheinyl transferase superfamily protein [Aquimarina megaterium]